MFDCRYDVQGRKLIVKGAEAASVRQIFARFIELGSATVLACELRRDGFRNKQGTLIDKGYLYRLLNNRVYRGEALHKGNSYPTEQARIIQLLVRRGTVTAAGLEVDFRREGIAGVVREMVAPRQMEAAE